jgi:hypothetical protein
MSLPGHTFSYRMYIELKTGKTLVKNYPDSRTFQELESELSFALGMTGTDSARIVQVFWAETGDGEEHFITGRSANKPVNSYNRSAEIPEIGSHWTWRKGDPLGNVAVVVTSVHKSPGPVAEWIVRMRRSGTGVSPDEFQIDLTTFWEQASQYRPAVIPEA